MTVICDIGNCFSFSEIWSVCIEDGEIKKSKKLTSIFNDRRQQDQN